jgi:uncharacterized membrane protein YfcA
MEYLIFFSIGILTGIITTLLGLGGGVIILPILLYITNIEIKTATAISAVQVFFASSFGTFFNWLQKTINFRYALAFGISSGITYFIGSYLTPYFPGNTIKIIYLGAVILALILFFIKRKNKNSNPDSTEIKNPDKKDFFKIVPIAMTAGFGFGVLGVGGGFFYVPLLIMLFDLPLKIAIGTSLMIVLCNAIPGIIGKLLSVRFDIFIGLAVAAGAIAGSKIGTYLNRKINVKVIRIIFIIFLSIIIARVGWDLYSSFAG